MTILTQIIYITKVSLSYGHIQMRTYNVKYGQSANVTTMNKVNLQI